MELVLMHISASPALGPPRLCPWGAMGTPCSGCAEQLLGTDHHEDPHSSTPVVAGVVQGVDKLG